MLNCSPVVFCRRWELPSGDFAMLICMMLHSTCSSTVLYNFFSKHFLFLFVDWHVCAQRKERALVVQRSCTNEDYRGNCASMHQCVHTQHTHIALQLYLCCVNVCVDTDVHQLSSSWYSSASCYVQHRFSPSVRVCLCV